MKVAKPKSTKRSTLEKRGKLSASLTLPLNNTDSGKSFNVRLADSSLDVYRSPHLIDLSRRHQAEDSMRWRPPAEFNYAEMPGGKFLDKYHILDFWDFSKSETIIAVKKFFLRWKSVYSSIFDRPEFAPLLIGEKQAKAAKSHLEEVTAVGIILSFADFYYKIYLFFYKFILVAGLMAQKLFSRDEMVYLSKDNLKKPLPATGLMERLIAVSHEPTISELLKPASAPQMLGYGETRPDASAKNPPAGGQDGKFKIVNYSPGRKKEIQEKYLAGNFTRKGVVVAPQPPSRHWPKESLSWDIGNFVFSPVAMKPAALLLGVLVALVISVKSVSYWEEIGNVRGRVMGEAEQALTNINSAAADIKSLDFNAAADKFSLANSKFVSAQNQLDEIKSFLTVLAEVAPAENTFKSGTNIIDMGEHLSNAAGRLLEGVSEAGAGSGLSLTSRIKNLSVAALPALEELKAAQANAANIGINNLPEDQRNKFIALKAALPEAIAGLQRLSDAAAFSVKALGDNDVRRYLLVFQNDNELRPTGGFMGSFALVDLRGGQIDKISIPEGGTYDVRAGFNRIIAPPEPLRLVANRWELQDSNWWPDYPTSAQNIKWFYEKSGGPTVDGVIAINSSFLGELLKLTGPIDLPEYGKTITADNFEYELQKSIELEATEKAKPKKILAELSPILLDKLMNSDPGQFFDLAEAISDGLRRRDIQLYFIDGDLQQFSINSNWAGKLDSPAGSDFLSLIAANIGGGKTDPVIKQKIYHTAEIQDDGSIIDKVLIERRNIGPTDNYFTTIANNAYIRAYVPEGSQLVYAGGFKGFDADKFKAVAEGAETKAELSGENNAVIDPESGTKIYNENGKTVFANWSVAGPGETRELLLVYKLPFRVSFSGTSRGIIGQLADYFSAETAAYSFKFQKQPGRNSDEISSVVSYPSSLNLKLSYPQSAIASGDSVSLSAKTDADRFLIAGFTKK